MNCHLYNPTIVSTTEPVFYSSIGMRGYRTRQVGILLRHEKCKEDSRCMFISTRNKFPMYHNRGYGFNDADTYACERTVV